MFVEFISTSSPNVFYGRVYLNGIVKTYIYKVPRYDDSTSFYNELAILNKLSNLPYKNVFNSFDFFNQITIDTESYNLPIICVDNDNKCYIQLVTGKLDNDVIKSLYLNKPNVLSGKVDIPCLIKEIDPNYGLVHNITCPATIKDCIMKICLTLTFVARPNNFIHGDLKCDNILYSKNSMYVRFIDFEFSMILKSETVKIHRTDNINNYLHRSAVYPKKCLELFDVFMLAKSFYAFNLTNEEHNLLFESLYDEFTKRTVLDDEPTMNNAFTDFFVVYAMLFNCGFRHSFDKKNISIVNGNTEFFMKGEGINGSIGHICNILNNKTVTIIQFDPRFDRELNRLREIANSYVVVHVKNCSRSSSKNDLYVSP